MLRLLALALLQYGLVVADDDDDAGECGVKSDNDDDDDDDCSTDALKHASDQCDFVVDNCDDPGASTFGSYLELFHCGASAALSLL